MRQNTLGKKIFRIQWFSRDKPFVYYAKIYKYWIYRDKLRGGIIISYQPTGACVEKITSLKNVYLGGKISLQGTHF